VPAAVVCFAAVAAVVVVVVVVVYRYESQRDPIPKISTDCFDHHWCALELHSHLTMRRQEQEVAVEALEAVSGDSYQRTNELLQADW
jgi:hypothetical protein